MALAQFFKNLSTLILLLLASTTFSHAALPEFVGTTEQKQLIKTAFEDAITLARTVALRWNPKCDAYLDRYFAPEDTTLVEHLFRAIADIPLDLDLEDLDEDDVKEFVDSLKPDRLNVKFKGLSISYGNHPAIPPDYLASLPQKCGVTGIMAFLTINRIDLTHVWMSLCPALFDKYYSLKDTESPSEALVKKGIPGLGCERLGNIETDYMHTTGATALHELFHWPYLFTDLPSYGEDIRRDPIHDYVQINDYNWEQRPDVTVNNPISGVGAFFAHQVRTLPDEEATGFVEAVNNADNYSCYATSRIWGLICNKEFAPVISALDWLRRNTPNQQQLAQVVKLQGGDPEQEGPVGCISDTTSNWQVCY
jgi:hypothetical protein